MTLVALDLHEGDRGGGRVQGVHDGAGFGGREQPVGGEGHHAEPGLRALEGVGEHAAPVGGEVEIVHRPGEVEVGVGVEALDEAEALVAQVALDLEVGVEREGRGRAALEAPAELPVQGRLRQVGDMRAHAGDPEALGGPGAGLEVAPLGPGRVGHDRLPADLVEGDVLRRVARPRGDRHRGEDPLGVARRPLQHLHAAHGAADTEEQVADAEPIEQHRLGADHVADGHQGEVEPVGPARRRVDGGRTRRAHAGADDVGADDEVAVGVDGLARPHQGLPPAALTRHRMGVGEVLVAGQRVADQDGVGAVRVEGAGRPVGDLEGGELHARIHRQGLVQTERGDEALRLAGLRHFQGRRLGTGRFVFGRAGFEGGIQRHDHETGWRRRRVDPGLDGRPAGMPSTRPLATGGMEVVCAPFTVNERAGARTPRTARFRV